MMEEGIKENDVRREKRRRKDEKVDDGEGKYDDIVWLFQFLNL